MKPLTITIVLIGLSGLLSCGANENNKTDSTGDVLKNYKTSADAAIGSEMTAVEPTESEAQAPTDDRKPLLIKKAWCDHQLSNQAGNNYHPSKMIDGNSATAWAAKLNQVDDYYENGLICGPVFDLATPSRIAGVELQNGYCKSNDSFKNNTRASWVRIYRYRPELDGENGEDQMMGFIKNSDIIYEGPLDDSMKMQYSPVSSSFDNSKPTRAVGLIFRFDRMHKGTKWNDLCLSEINVYGK